MFLTDTDIQLLHRLKSRSAELVRRYRKTLKYRKRIRAFDQKELETIQSLCDLERITEQLLNQG